MNRATSRETLPGGGDSNQGVAEGAMEERPQGQFRIPAGFSTAGDPIEGNPFPVADERHRAWRLATRRAEQAGAQLDSQLLEGDVPASLHFPLSARFVVGVVGKFDIWAARCLPTLRVDGDLPFYDDWLVSYGNSWLAVARQARLDVPREAVLSLLTRRLTGRVEHWKAEARHCLESPDAVTAPLPGAEPSTETRQAPASDGLHNRSQAGSRSETEKDFPIHENVFAQLEDGRWEICFDGKRAPVWGAPKGSSRYLRGMELIRAALRNPGEQIRPETAVGGALVPLTGQDRADSGSPSRGTTGFLPDGAPAFDSAAGRSYKNQIERLKEDRDRAKEFGHTVQVAALEDEVLRISNHIRANTDLKGRPRRVGSDKNHARKRMDEIYRTALKRLRHSFPALALHLRSNLRSRNGEFAYRPKDASTRWRT